MVAPRFGVIVTFPSSGNGVVHNRVLPESAPLCFRFPYAIESGRPARSSRLHRSSGIPRHPGLRPPARPMSYLTTSKPAGVRLAAPVARFWRESIRNGVRIGVASLLCLLSAPAMLAVAVTIAVVDGRPVFDVERGVLSG